MPELPDVEYFRKIAKKALGKQVQLISINKSRILKTSTTTIRNHLKNKKILSTKRHGKLLFLQINDGYYLILHFGMTGKLVYYNLNKKILEFNPNHLVIELKLPDEKGLIYLNYRKFGKLDITNSIKKYLEENKIGKDALNYSKKEFKKLFEKSSQTIKSLLMDQNKIAGIGNIYSDEILFHAKIKPDRKINNLNKKEIERVHKEMFNVLKKAIRYNVNLKKIPNFWLIHHRKKQETCPGCNGEIKQIKINGRTGYYCPNCQK